jgi:hypothetical protein
MTKTLCVLVALLALVAAGCGSGSSGSGSDTAKLAPATSFFYAEANIDPTGAQEAGMRSILADLPGSAPPQERLNQLLEQASQSDKTAKVDYEKDIRPWLGDQAAVFVAPAKGGGASPAWAAVIATTDEGKAKDAIDKGKESGDRKLSYNGSDYLLSKDSAMAVVDGYFVAGSDAGVRAAIDASKSSSLAGSDQYKEAIKNATDERVALVYEDLGGMLQALASSSSQSLGPAAPFIGRMFGGKPVVATISAEQQALVVNGSLIPGAGSLNLFGRSTSLLGEAPANSWLALGQADFGNVVKTMVGLFAGALGGADVLNQQLQAATGLDLDRDVYPWIGDVALFVSGTSKASIGGGAVIKSKDAATSRRTLTKLAALAARSGRATVAAADVAGVKGYELKLDSAPKPLYLLQANDRVAITYGAGAAKEVFSGAGGKLSSNPKFTAATSKLGEAYAPSLYVDVPPIIDLADSFGASGADWDKAKPYLSIVDYVVSGSAESGDTAAARTRIGFKPHS